MASSSSSSSSRRLVGDGAISALGAAPVPYVTEETELDESLWPELELDGIGWSPRSAPDGPVACAFNDDMKLQLARWMKRKLKLPWTKINRREAKPMEGHTVTEDHESSIAAEDDELADLNASLIGVHPIDDDKLPTPEEPAANIYSSVLELNSAHHRSLLYYESTRYMDPQVYRSAIDGTSAFDDIECGRVYGDQVTPRGNTILHLAVELHHDGNHDMELKILIKRCPLILEEKNYKGDLALHVAARVGHASMLKILLRGSQWLATNHKGKETDSYNNVLQKVNSEGNTALHIALENRHQEVAEFLASKDVTVSNYKNRKGKSPLCLAAEAGYTELVNLMLAKKSEWGYKSYNNPNELVNHHPRLTRMRGWYCDGKEKFEGESLVHAAIKGGNKDVLEATLKYERSLVKLSIDEEGRTPLSFAAYKGYLDMVQYLLKKSTETAYIRDRTGLFPIHMASSQGHIEIVKEFLQCCPDSRELLVDEHGQNILHVAATCGKAKMVTYMLKTQELEMLINERDYDGNTPLHLATKYWHPKVVSILTWDKKVRLDIVNNAGWTAMGFAQNTMESVALRFQKRLTLIALRAANAPSEPGSGIREELKSSTLIADAALSESGSKIGENLSSVQSPNTDQYRDRLNTLLLVATLVATVTFTAGFTMPGGYNDSGSQNKGIATFVTKHAFQAFLICDTIAMYSSIIVAISLFFAQLGDLQLIVMALKVALPFLGLAVTTMSAAFMAGTYLVVSNHSWLGIVVLILGSIFFIIILALFILLYSPTSSHKYFARYVFYYPFNWMILLTGSDSDRN